eukprot:CAMPEP_0196653800 /NCGR_PEP_ID=MMETSP1086-20130531/3456_1 /TAXON_ID=77921 /ORGANISM="Cyanoptyche  gloeocystis , Strain SAG4.97" /LENGTH=316 /DNA_ID=CAMNT_0041985179 /DNA_START=30 /DNA_END=977 /DNA_ORIENTATION=+
MTPLLFATPAGTKPSAFPNFLSFQSARSSAAVQRPRKALSRRFFVEPTRPELLRVPARHDQTVVAQAISSVAERAPGLVKTKALIFDCDGVIVESEDGHRIAYNEAFAEKGLGVEWDTEFYGRLQNSIGGGKEKMTWWFEQNGWPSGVATEQQQNDFIHELHVSKTDAYLRLIENGLLELRPGVRRVILEAADLGVPLAVCSAANRRAVEMALSKILGSYYLDMFELVLAGDDVKKKKPNPDIYLTAAGKLGVQPADCVVIEDSRIGLLAAKGAGMRCIVTFTDYTANEDFAEADAVFPELGDFPNTCYVSVKDLW